MRVDLLLWFVADAVLEWRLELTEILMEMGQGEEWERDVARLGAWRALWWR